MKNTNIKLSLTIDAGTQGLPMISSYAPASHAARKNRQTERAKILHRVQEKMELK